MKECKLCSTVVDENAKRCPSCGCDPDTGMAFTAERDFRRAAALRAKDRHWSQCEPVPAKAV